MSFQLDGRTAVITGGGGAIGGAIARALAAEGVSVAIWDISRGRGEATAEDIRDSGGTCTAAACDVTDRGSVRSSLDRTVEEFGGVDILVNGAGGSRRETTTSGELSFFEIEVEAMAATHALNYLSAVIPSQAVGRLFAEKASGCIINVTSVAGLGPLSRALSYSDAKAGANSFTRWLAVHMAREYSPRIRVNAIAPGFLLTDQNRFLLVDGESGELTGRGEDILRQVPMSRFGDPAEIAGAALWLASDLAGFVTGTVVVVDGGFTAFAGV